MANISSRDLSQLRALGVKGVSGSVTAKARVERTKTHLHIDADASALGLVVQGNKVGKARSRTFMMKTSSARRT